MKNFYSLIVVFCMIVGTLTLTSCGKVSAPSPIEGSDYPRSYPIM